MAVTAAHHRFKVVALETSILGGGLAHGLMVYACLPFPHGMKMMTQSISRFISPVCAPHAPSSWPLAIPVSGEISESEFTRYYCETSIIAYALQDPFKQLELCVPTSMIFTKFYLCYLMLKMELLTKKRYF